MNAAMATLAFSPDEATPPPVLRDYQTRVCREVLLAWAAGQRNILVVAATGAGKTIIAAELVRRLVARHRRILFVVHRDVLIPQTAEKFSAFGIPHGYIKANYAENRGALVQIASVQTLERRDWWYAQGYTDENPPTIFFDEAHITAFSRVAVKLLAAHGAMRAVGLTATPWRLSPREGLGDVFESVVTAPFPAELMEAGHLAPPAYYGTKAPPDLRGVRTRHGDYREEDLLEACDRPELIAALYADWERLAPGKRTLLYSTGVAHAEHIAAAFAARGVPAASVDGSTPIPERTRLYDALRRGELLALASCQVLTEGFDVPEVECIALARPTKSRALFMQQIGRGLRPAPWIVKERCVILDQAGNVGRFGFVEDFTEYSLERGNPAARGSVAREVAATRQCPICQRIEPAAARVCSGCGFEWPSPDDKRRPARVAPLQELGYQQQGGALSLAEKALLYRDFLRLAHRRGYKPEAAAVKYRDLVGAWPERAWTRGAVLGLHPDPEEIEAYALHLVRVAQEKGVDEEMAPEWVAKWLRAEAHGADSSTERGR